MDDELIGVIAVDVYEYGRWFKRIHFVQEHTRDIVFESTFETQCVGGWACFTPQAHTHTL